MCRHKYKTVKTQFILLLYKIEKILSQPWLVWLSGLSVSLRTEGSPVRFPFRVRAWVVGWVPSWGCARGN